MSTGLGVITIFRKLKMDAIAAAMPNDNDRLLNDEPKDDTQGRGCPPITLFLAVLCVSTGLVVGCASTTFISFEANNAFLEETALDTFRIASYNIMTAYIFHFRVVIEQSASIVASYELAVFSGALTKPHEWFIQNVMISQGLEPDKDPLRIAIYMTSHLLVSQEFDDGRKFTVANFTSNKMTNYQVTSYAPFTVEELDTRPPPTGLMQQWDLIFAGPTLEPHFALDVNGDVIFLTWFPLSVTNASAGLLAIKSTFAAFEAILGGFDSPFEQKIESTVITKLGVVMASTLGNMSAKGVAPSPLTHCMSIDENVTVRCTHTAASFVAISSLLPEAVEAYPTLLESVEGFTKNSTNTLPIQFSIDWYTAPLRNVQFGFQAKNGRSYLVAAPSAFGMIGIAIAPADIVLQDYAQLYQTTIWTVAVISMVFGLLMGLLQLGVLIAVRRVVSGMVDACATALEGVIARRNAGKGPRARPEGSFLAWFSDTGRIVEANAALDALVTDLMAALPSKEAPSALRRVQDRPAAAGTANPLDPPDNDAAAAADDADRTVASMLQFHLGSLSLLHGDDNKAYSDIMSSAMGIVHDSGGVLERVSGSYLVATYNCHWACEAHAQVATDTAVKIHRLMVTHHATASVRLQLASVTYLETIGSEYCVLVDCAPFKLYAFEEVGATASATMRCSVVKSRSDELLQRLAPLLSAEGVRVAVTSAVACRIAATLTCVVDCVQLRSSGEQMELHEVYDEATMTKAEHCRISQGMEEMRAGHYEPAARRWRLSGTGHRHEQRLKSICELALVRNARGTSPARPTRGPAPYVRKERPTLTGPSRPTELKV